MKEIDVRELNKASLIGLFMGITLSLGMVYLILHLKSLENKPVQIEVAPEELDKPEHFTVEVDEWEVFYMALCHVESRNNPNAVGTTGDHGIIQITQICVDEANRLQKSVHYTLLDTMDPDKSREIFDIIQGVHNPGKDFHLALKIWNPKAPISYHRKVINRFNELIKEM